MNGRKRETRPERVKCNSIKGITCILAENNIEKSLKVLKYLRTKMAEELKTMPGVNRLDTYVIDGKWFLTGDGNVHEIVCPPPEVIPQCGHVMHTEDFRKATGIKAFSCKSIE